MGLRSRIIGVLALLVIVTALSVSLLIFSGFDEQLVAAKVADLEHESELVAQGFQDGIDELSRDTLLLSKMPPIEGMIRAIEGGGLDALDGSSFGSWKGRLVQIFKQKLIHNPSHLQIRFIGMNEGGRELVDVYRKQRGGRIEVTEASDLQAKGGRDYFIATLKQPVGSVYLSRIELNREFGEIQEPRTPTLRASTPIRVNGNPIGIVVINYAVAEEFETLVRLGSRNHEIYLTDELGRYVYHPDRSRAFEFEFGCDGAIANDLPEVAKVLSRAGQPFDASANDGRVVSGRRVDYGSAELGRALGVFTVGSLADATQVSSDVAKRTVAVASLLTLIAIFLGSWLAYRLTEPVLRLARAVEDSESSGKAFKTPGDLSGEAAQLGGALTHALTSLTQRNQDLEVSNHELQQFAYIASHDLQEPTRTIQSFARLLDAEYGDAFDKTGRDSLRYILDSSQRMHSLIYSLLEYSRIGRESASERIDMEQLIRDVVDDLGSTIDEAEAQVVLGAFPVVTGYAIELRVLFQNLIGNAIKFRRPDESPLIEVTAEREGGGWIFRVADNGIGIEPKHRDRVFLIFQRLHGRDEYDGTGIGLAHCRKVVDLHRGRIWIEESNTGGACFCVKLNGGEI
ncbi:MAG: ATP-binding protein [Myxococcota bacterium]